MTARAVLIAGPTASGKTAHAIELAREADAVIINADSMQVYRELAIVTARPGERETSQCRHELFGHVGAAEAYSVARWLDDVAGLLPEIERTGKTAIFVGGTGLYFNALIGGLSPVPPIDPQIREKWRSRVDPDHLHDELVKRDRAAADRLDPTDLQRIRRALEVIDSTGRSIFDWQSADRGEPLVMPQRARRFVLSPPRPALYARIEARCEAMIEAGALEEVRALKEMDLDPSLPAMRAIGVPQLAAHLSGELPLEMALERFKTESRRYAKRQLTWFRNQFAADWQWTDPS